MDAGFARLVGVDPRKVIPAVKDWWVNGTSVKVKKKSPFGDGNAAEKSVDILNKAGYC